MNEPKNLLVVTPNNPLPMEAAERLREYAEDKLGLELLILSPGDKAELHDRSLAAKIDKLCEGIANLVDVNQAMLEYMINADQEPPEQLGGSLDD